MERTWYDNVEAETGWGGLELADAGWVGTGVIWSTEVVKLEYPMCSSSPRENTSI
jgi:hypothetical protein